VGPFNVFSSNKKLAKELLAKHGLVSVCQIHTCGYPIGSFAVEDHLASFRALAEEAQEMGAVLVNVHTGVDAWSLDDSVKFFKAQVTFEKSLPFKVVHETHRRRVFFNPWVTRDVIARVPEVNVNCDLSHWAVVGERLFDDPADSPKGWNWPELVANTLAPRTLLIHARVGYAHGPQAPEPFAPEYADALAAHMTWWDSLAAARARAGEVLYIEPEHGPAPYLHTLPYTNVPVADLWHVNTKLGEHLIRHFAAKQFLNELPME
jgi:hypothetical protein